MSLIDKLWLLSGFVLLVGSVMLAVLIVILMVAMAQTPPQS